MCYILFSVHKEIIMKLICNGLDLADSFSKVTKAITSKSNIPILEGVKLSAKGSKLTLTASDTEITIENTINATIMLEGELVVPGKLTAELVRKMGGQQVELECIDGKVLVIKYMDSNTKISLMNIDEYPKFADNDYDISFNIGQKEFKDIINKTVFCAATDDTRPILKGCLVSVSGDNIKCVAIDGLRLAVTKSVLNSDCGEKNIIAPAKVLQEISKLLNDSDETFRLHFNDKKMMADIGDTKVIASQLEGDYISYDRIIPKSFVTNVNVTRSQLEDALDRASIISRNIQSCLIKIDISENVMTLTAKSDIGDICEKVPVNMEGKDIKLAVNSKYIIDCLKNIDDEYIKISLSSSIDPFVITPLSGDNYLYLILPVRIING